MASLFGLYLIHNCLARDATARFKYRRHSRVRLSGFCLRRNSRMMNLTFLRLVNLARRSDTRCGLRRYENIPISRGPITDKATDTALRTWCDKGAALGVNMLVVHGSTQPESFDTAQHLVADEIRIRIVMGDQPPD